MNNKAYRYVHPDAEQNISVANDLAIAADSAETTKARLLAAKDFLAGKTPVIRGPNAKRNAEVTHLANEALDHAYTGAPTLEDTPLDKQFRLLTYRYEDPAMPMSEIANREAIVSLGLAAVEAERQANVAMANVNQPSDVPANHINAA